MRVYIADDLYVTVRVRIQVNMYQKRTKRNKHEDRTTSKRTTIQIQKRVTKIESILHFIKSALLLLMIFHHSARLQYLR